MKASVIIFQEINTCIGDVEGDTLDELNQKAEDLWKSKKYCGVDLNGTYSKEEPKILVIGNVDINKLKDSEISEEDLL